jgi:PHD/YefM family antitoxin component YafN of YafNO toxin-antitoxin module
MARAYAARMVQHLPLTQARINLGAVVKRVHLNNEYVVLEKDGIPVAGVMPIDEFEDYLELRNPKARVHIRKSNAEYLAGKSRPAEDFLADLRRQATRKSRQQRPR